MPCQRGFSISKCLLGMPLVLLAWAEPHRSAAQEAAKFELLHLWAEGVEAHALEAFSEPMRAAGVDWQEQITRRNFRGVQQIFSERLAQGLPPSGLFWIGGGDAADQLIEQGIFKIIRPPAGSDALQQRLRPEVFEAVRYKDGLSVLPVGIHLENYVVYNDDILADLDEPVPSNWEDFVRAAEKASRRGHYGLSLSDEVWQIRIFMGSVIAEYLDADAMQRLASQTKLDDEQRDAITKAFQTLARIRPFINPDFKDLNWAMAVNHVIEGRAMAVISGDWVAPLLPEGRNLTCALPPGNDYPKWSFDSIALTNASDPAEIRGQDQFVETVLDPQNAANYVSRKGGVPILRDFDPDMVTGCAKVSVAAWENAETRVELTSQEWNQSMELIGGFARTYVNDPGLDLDTLTAQLLAAIQSLEQFEIDK